MLSNELIIEPFLHFIVAGNESHLPPFAIILQKKRGQPQWKMNNLSKHDNVNKQ